MDLSLNNLPRLTFLKTQTTNQPSKPNQSFVCTELNGYTYD